LCYILSAAPLMSYIIETNFLNVKEVSVFLKLSALTIYKYISEKKIKAIHFGGRYLIDKSSLNKFLKKKSTKTS
jgi:excisionase family DNA binding protein